MKTSPHFFELETLIDTGTSARLFLSTTITSQKKDYRSTIRDFLYFHLAHTLGRKVNRDLIVDLKSIPSFEDIGISLSHSKVGSAIIVDETNKCVGIDIEDPARIENSIIQRISTEQEIQNCPNPKLLFTAKEAAWKALNRKLNISTIPLIEITQWLPLGNETFQFCAHFNETDTLGKGYCVLKSQYQLSWFTGPQT